MSLKSKLSLILTTAVALLLVPAMALAEEPGVAANKFDANKWIAAAAGFAIGIAAFGGTTGQARAASAALEGIARNPQASGKIFTPMIIALALTESLVLLGFLIANGLSGKIGG